LDVLGDGDAVLGDARRAEGLVEHDVAALRAERHLDGIGEDVDAAQHLATRIGAKLDVFSSHIRFSLESRQNCRGALDQAAFFLLATPSMMPMMSDSFMIRSSSPSSFTSVPDHLPNRTRSPTLTSSG